MSSISKRIADLRAWMSTNNVDAVIIPSTDPHQSEYPTGHDRVRAWISGFYGSAGTVVVTSDTAGLWTDSRYFLEAATAIEGTEIQLFRMHTPGVADYPDWLLETLPEGARLAFDFRTVAMSVYRSIVSRTDEKRIDLIDMGDAISEIWIDRPALPCEPIVIVPTETAGEDAASKLKKIAAEMQNHGCAYHVVSTLDDIAWILNMRGTDVRYNPVFLAYLIIGPETATLYTDPERLDETAKKHLSSNDVEHRHYDRFYTDAGELAGPVLLDPQRTSQAIADTLTADIVETNQPSTEAKARKNRTEISCLRDAMRADGVAMVKFLRWFDEAVAAGADLDELSVAAALQERRRQIPEYVSDSFNYISGFNGNGAIVHYAADETSKAKISAPGVYLIDSGGQYTNGTTDITRTVAVGPTPPDAKRDFTLVLKGVIALSMLRFPEGTTGHEIDAIARAALWRDGKNYGHGTGHGVGFFLNVHEGPQRIAPTAADYPLEPGMVVSNEPGLYRPGKWGIRVENLLVISEPVMTDFGSFLSFETLTLCPIDRRMIEEDLFAPDEKEWLNTYHRRVFEELSPSLDTVDTEWLKKATVPFS